MSKIREFGQPMFLTSNAVSYSGGAATVRVPVPRDETVLVLQAQASGGKGGLFNRVSSFKYLDMIERVLGSHTNKSVPLTAIASAGLTTLSTTGQAGTIERQKWHGDAFSLASLIRRHAAFFAAKNGGDAERLAARAIQSAAGLLCGCTDASGFVVGGMSSGDITLALTDASGDNSDEISRLTFIGVKIGGPDTPILCGQHNSPYWQAVHQAYTTSAAVFDVSEQIENAPDQADALVHLATTAAGPATLALLNRFSLDLYSGTRGARPVHNGRVPAGVMCGGYGRPSPRLFWRAVDRLDRDGFSIEAASGADTGTLILANQYVAWKPADLMA